MLAATAEDELGDVIDVSQLLCVDDNKDNVTLLDESHDRAQPTPIRAKKCSVAHSHIRLLPPSSPTSSRTSPLRYDNHSVTQSRSEVLSSSSSPFSSSNRSAVRSRSELLPPSPPPIPPCRLNQPPPSRLPVRVLQVRPTSSPYPLFPVRLVHCVRVSREQPSTSDVNNSPESDESVSPPPSAPCTAVISKPPPIEQRFPGTREISMFGKHDVLRYTIPGGEKCYIFLFKRANHNHDVYRCRDCKKSSALTTVKVVGDEFLSDPCKEDHDCVPIDCVKDKVERLVYKKWREMQQNPRYANSACREIWMEILDAFDDESLGDVEEREKMRLVYEAPGYDNRRITIARNLKRLRKMMFKEALESRADEAKQLLQKSFKAFNSISEGGQREHHKWPSSSSSVQADSKELESQPSSYVSDPIKKEKDTT